MTKSKALLIICTLIIIIFGFYFYKNKNYNYDLNKINLIEVTHSIFYAPQYVALEKGFFKEEGLEINLSIGNGSDKAMTALISKDADIGLLGPETSIYIYNQGKENYMVNFALLTQKAGNYLISRIPISNFTWDDVKNKKIIGGRAGGMPEMILEYVLKKNNINPSKDVEIIQNLQFSSTASAFASGLGDFTIEFEPSAFTLEKQNKGYIALPMSKSSGIIPYTSYMASKEFIKNNPEKIQHFTNAIYKAQMWVNTHSAKEIAEVIHPYFKENNINELSVMIDRYLKQDVWNITPLFLEKDFNLLQNILDSSGELNNRVDFNDLVNNSFSKNSIKCFK